MINLSDTQRILLSTASQGESGSLLPLPACLTAGGGTAKSIEALIKRGLAEERETGDSAAVRRTDGDLRYGVFVTAAGLAAIGVEAEGAAGDEPVVAEVERAAPASATTRAPSKVTLVLGLLRRPAGATLPELIEVTGWLPHTIRAALTGLRKKGHVVERAKRDGATCYRIVVAG